MTDSSAAIAAKPKERPIIFSGPMVREILKGGKTQTRRIAKAVPMGEISMYPYEVGMRLWVRETFALQCEVDGDEPPFQDGRPIQRFDDDDSEGPRWFQPHYRATDPPPELEIGTGEPGVIWKPSIHMPRWASRITLEITEVRVQRLHEISDEDCMAEGITDNEALVGQISNPWVTAYASLWEAIHGAGAWGLNPWVWAVTFKTVPTPKGVS